MRNWAPSVADLDIERSLVLGNGIKRNNIDFLDRVKMINLAQKQGYCLSGLIRLLTLLPRSMPRKEKGAGILPAPSCCLYEADCYGTNSPAKPS